MKTSATCDDKSQTENKCGKCANYHFNKFSASASLCSLIISAEVLHDDQALNVVLIFKDSGFQIILTKLLPQAYFYFRVFNLINFVGYQVVQSYTCKEYVKTYNS